MNGGLRQVFSNRSFRVLAPAAVGMLFLCGWEEIVRWYEIPPYILPSPVLVGETLWTDGGSLVGSLWITLRVTGVAFASAVILGVLIAVLFSQSRLLETSLFPYAIALQVTPVVSIAPLIIVWTRGDYFLALLICAWIVAFFPVVANTTLGLRSVDRNLAALFRLYGASRWQILRYLQLPTALPFFLAGARISGGLALVGVVVSEFVAETGGAETGLAARILEASYRLEIAREIAALVLLSLSGITIYFVLDGISRLLLSHWHESVLPEDE